MPKSETYTYTQTQQIHGFNAINRGVYIADNLPFLKSLNDECIDLVCIDPPFAKNETFTGERLKPPLTQQEKENELRLLKQWGIENKTDADKAGIAWPDESQGGYKDIWSWEDDIHEEWMNQLDTNYEGISKVIDASLYVHGEDVAAYLCYMAIRLIEIHRVLKPTGSLYLHCDHTANGYLRQLLDGIFGKGNLRNEIVWHYNKWTNTAGYFQRNHDTIFLYCKAPNPTFNKQYGPPTSRQEQLRKTGYNLGSNNGLNILRVYDRIKAAEQISIAEKEGRTVYYIDEPLKGAPVPDVWNMSALNGRSNERTGYPTQKPIALAERIIAASSNPGDIVLDCFAGCAYSAIAAEKLNRRWIACDMNPRAWTVFKRQFNKKNLVLLRCHDETTGQQVMASEPVVTVHGPNELPERTSPISETQPKEFQLKERKYKVQASIIPEPEMLKMLLELSGYMAWCCGFANRRPDGTIIKTTRNFHLDHKNPTSNDGSNQIINRAPMCPHHNLRKSNRRLDLADYRKEIAHAGEMMVDKTTDLIDLAYADQQTLDIYYRERRARETKTS